MTRLLTLLRHDRARRPSILAVEAYAGPQADRYADMGCLAPGVERIARPVPARTDLAAAS